MTLQFHVVTTQRELNKPDCDGLFLVNRFKASGSRSYDFDNESDRKQLRALFRKPSHTSVARHLSRSDAYASAKRRRQAAAVAVRDVVAGFATVNGDMPLPLALEETYSSHALEVDKLRRALAELVEARARAANGGVVEAGHETTTKKKRRRAWRPRELDCKEENVRLRMRELRLALGDARAAARLAAAGPVVPDGRLVLVLFPCPRTGIELANVAGKTACCTASLRPETLGRATGGRLALREVCIVLIDETWPRARKMFYEILSETFDGGGAGSEGADAGADADVIAPFFAEAEWARLRGTVVEAAGKRFNPFFERNAMVVAMGPEDTEERARHGLITNFGRKQVHTDVHAVCTLEAAVRLAEMVGQLSFEGRVSAQRALNEYLAGKPVGRSHNEKRSEQ